MEDIIRAPLDSEEGQRLLAEASIQQPLLMRIFQKQVVDGYCGVTSAALILSAKHFGEKSPEIRQKEFDVDIDVGKVPYTESNMFDYEETRSVIGDGESLRRVGADLDEICALLRSHGLQVTMKRHPGEVDGIVDAEADVNAFRREAVEALTRADSSSGVIVNFQQDATLWYGHFSPLAAYHEGSDCFLLLDIRPDKPIVWVDVEGLFRRLKAVDDATKLPRGYVIIR